MKRKVRDLYFKAFDFLICQGQLNANGSMTKSGGNEYFSVPGHTPVIFSEVGGRTLYRLLARDAGGETEGVLLNETVPRSVLTLLRHEDREC